MKKRNLLGALLCAASLAVTAILPNTVMADATKVVTLGADLSDAQKSTMMKYFKVNKDEAQIIYVTNDDERKYLSAYVPSAQIGTRTVSCAYVKPTSSGGIKVRTANLNYVTCNMIASTLSTSGVSHCEVVAACPFEVSGTGALTGIMMAYEKATGKELDSQKKDIATHEMVVTGNLAESIESNKEAVNIINSGKMEVVGNEIQDADEIYNIVVNIAQENNIDISKEQLDEIVSLLEEIAHQDYNYDDMKETLENVEENVGGTEDMFPIEEPTDEDQEEQPEDPDSILNDLDITALGDDVLESSTEDPTLEIETGMTTETDVPEEEWDWDESEDVWGDLEETDEMDDEVLIEGTDWTEEVPEEVQELEEDELNTDMLSPEQKEKFEQLEKFCKGEFGGDIDILKEVMGEDAYPAIVLDTEVSEKLTKDVLKLYLELLKKGVSDYVPSDMDQYFTAELNILAKDLKELMQLEGFADPESYLAEVPEMDRQVLYEDTMKFFEKLYDEVSMSVEESWSEEAEESYEESYDEYSEEETDGE